MFCSMCIHFQYQRPILICLYNVLHIKSFAFFSLAVQKLSQFCWALSCSSPYIEITYFSKKKKKKTFADILHLLLICIQDLKKGI